jgi:hypothetical protein
MITLVNSKYQFSLYNNLLDVKEPERTIDINQLVEIIKNGYIRKEIKTLRRAKTLDEAKDIKLKSIPAVTVSGIFKHRDHNGLVTHSGLIQIDIDELDDYDKLYSKLCKDKYTYVCFRSPRGKGIKVIFKINPDEKTHRFQYDAIEYYFKKRYDIVIDSACKDIPRPMLLSYDPDIFCNPYAKRFEKQFDPPKPKKKKLNADSIKRDSTQSTAESVETLITELERTSTDITGSHGDWIKIGFALATEFGERGRDYFIRISSMYSGFNQEECDKQYTQLLKSNNQSTHIGSLFFIANQYLT